MHDKPQYFNTAISIKTTGSELLVWSSFILIAPYTQKCGSVTPSNHGLNEWINIVQSEAEGFATKHIDLIEAIVYSCLYSALKFMLQTNTAVKHRKPVTHTMFLHSIRCLKLPIKSLFGKFWNGSLKMSVNTSNLLNTRHDIHTLILKWCLVCKEPFFATVHHQTAKPALEIKHVQTTKPHKWPNNKLSVHRQNIQVQSYIKWIYHLQSYRPRSGMCARIIQRYCATFCQVSNYYKTLPAPLASKPLLNITFE